MCSVIHSSHKLLVFALQVEVLIAKFEGEHSRGHINTQGALPDWKKENHDQELVIHEELLYKLISFPFH